jgi:fumarate reductase subunit C
MGAPAHPQAMTPKKPGRTRTAPPQMPSSWWSASRIRTYLLFDMTGFVYLLLGFVALRLVWALGEGPEVWSQTLASFNHPLYIAFHILGLASVIFVGIRFFRLFPKAQPPAIGPFKPPPGPVIHAGLYVAWVAVAVSFSLVLAGVLF